MFSTDDTIVAIATPPGRGGIGVVRISGPARTSIAARDPRRAAPARSRAAPRCTRVAAWTQRRRRSTKWSRPTFPRRTPTPARTSSRSARTAARSCCRRSSRSAIAAGARLAEPGEFTLRAFLNGKRDLVQAEAVADLIDAATPLQARVAFDQLEGTLTARIAAIDARAVRSDRAARGVARFSRRGLSLHRAGARRRARSRGVVGAARRPARRTRARAG